MPETPFRIRWPDGIEQVCYCPSRVIGEVLAPGQIYAIDDFLARCRDGLTRASDRVEALYGFACTASQAQLDAIETRGAQFDGGSVTCLAIGATAGQPAS